MDAGFGLYRLGDEHNAPSAKGPRLQVATGGENVCGSVTRASGGSPVLATAFGERHIVLAAITAVRIVESCP
ncbi:hypothetical protein [Alloactinosynnema sp. L-07]|uniref:hypothetical protein n=1 Tax=Alloactinosynnema sp. L-07 TaxID=1653480 RepID=UPI00065EF934|nr:hypothetical protein [Alloactinosynnema sp. L-07]CRK56845.1 hypothetical protein [Alloactinosynnema sp. L-07]